MELIAQHARPGPPSGGPWARAARGPLRGPLGLLPGAARNVLSLCVLRLKKRHAHRWDPLGEGRLYVPHAQRFFPATVTGKPPFEKLAEIDPLLENDAATSEP